MNRKFTEASSKIEKDEFKYWANYDSRSHKTDHTVDIKNKGDTKMDISSDLTIESINNKFTRMEECDKYDSKAEIKLEKIKSEAHIYGHEIDNMDLEQLHDEVEIKNESDASADFTGDLVVNSSAKTKVRRQEHQVLQSKAERELLRCHHCTYNTYGKVHLIEHMKCHSNGWKQSTNDDVCVRLNFDDAIKKHTKSDASKAPLNVHMNRKLLSKSYRYAISKNHKCVHCNAVFFHKASLDQHILRKHPKFIASVACKTRACKKCEYNTTVKVQFDRHIMSKHPDMKSTFKLSNCVHCSATFKSKKAMNDHILKKHPKCIASVTGKIYECKLCTFKAAFKNLFDRHMLSHPEVKSDFKFSNCEHCNAAFKSKIAKNHHVLKEHPQFIESVTSKIYECKVCIFKTVFKDRFEKHILNHPEVKSSFKLSNCVHCKAIFKSKISRDTHVLKEHPQFIESVTSKIHECMVCSFKTTIKKQFDRHMLKHP